MVDNKGCAYCFEGPELDEFGIKICDLPASKLYLFKEQSHKGRVIVAHKKHVSEFVELTDEEREDILWRTCAGLFGLSFDAQESPPHD